MGKKSGFLSAGRNKNKTKKMHKWNCKNMCFLETNPNRNAKFQFENLLNRQTALDKSTQFLNTRTSKPTNNLRFDIWKHSEIITNTEFGSSDRETRENLTRRSEDPLAVHYWWFEDSQKSDFLSTSIYDRHYFERLFRSRTRNFRIQNFHVANAHTCLFVAIIVDFFPNRNCVRRESRRFFDDDWRNYVKIALNAFSLRNVLTENSAKIIQTISNRYSIRLCYT